MSHRDLSLALWGREMRRYLEIAEREPALTEILYDGDGRTVLDIGGDLVEDLDSELNNTTVLQLGALAASYSGQRFSEDRPFLSVAIEGGWRVSFTRPPLSPRVPTMSLRKLLRTPLPIEKYIADGIMTESEAEHMKQLVRMRRSLIISGATSSGKTTLARCLLEMVDRADRIITIEAPCELQLTDETGTEPRRHWVALESQPTGMTLGECLRAALRMRPDRLVVGEVRGPEALELIRAANTGHRGIITTVHSNGAIECIDRLHSLCAEAQPTFPREVVARSIDAVIQIVGMGKNRRIEQIWEPSVTDRLQAVAAASSLAS